MPRQEVEACRGKSVGGVGASTGDLGGVSSTTATMRHRSICSVIASKKFWSPPEFRISPTFLGSLETRPAAVWRRTARAEPERPDPHCSEVDIAQTSINSKGPFPMLAPESILAWIIIGAIAGWLAGLARQRLRLRPDRKYHHRHPWRGYRRDSCAAHRPLHGIDQRQHRRRAARRAHPAVSSSAWFGGPGKQVADLMRTGGSPWRSLTAAPNAEARRS